jgi:hypothetical protein
MSEGASLSRWAFAVLRPIVRLLRAAGVTEEMIHAHVSRALALHRQDTVRGRLDAPMSQDRVRALGNLLASWSRSPDWAGADGMPRDLALGNEEPRSFPALVALQSPGMSPDEVLALLERFGAVARVTDGTRVRLLSAVLLHTSEEGFAAEPVLTDLRRFAETIEYNVFEKAANGPGRFQMSTLRSNIDPARAEDFARYVRRTGGGMLAAADDELARYENREVSQPESFGIGVFMFRDEPDRDDGSGGAP